MYELLRRLDLRPKEWEDLVRATGHASPSSVTWSPALQRRPRRRSSCSPRTTSSPSTRTCKGTTSPTTRPGPCASRAPTS
ncbi:hypothetical protein RI578_17225 [Streptomyces sp. BB1-1-1]|nr:hypothetical protein [Streptomyces sp. BB1-1-1]WND40318.1 hypothetical protein RI578_17225 [Streptomyces sp. BB1-1-1]